MDINVFKRDPAKVYTALAETNNQLIAKEPIRIYIPLRYVEKNLAYVGTETYTVGIFMMATEDNSYALSSVNAMVQLSPTNTTTVMMDDTPYYEFYFRKGAVIIPNLNLVIDNKLVYFIFDEYFTKGKIPWFVNYLDLSGLFRTAQKHAKVNIGANHEVLELLVSMISRDSKDRTVYYRQSVNNIHDLTNNPPAFIPLRSVQYAATNTTNKLAGSYFRPALVSALVNPSDRVERVESLLGPGT